MPELPEFLSQFNFPKEALQDFRERGIIQKNINRGGGASVDTFEMAGHDKGVSFRFVNIPVKQEVASQEYDMEINKEYTLIEWTKDRKNKIVERVYMIGDELLKFRKQKIERMVTDEHGRQLRHVEFQPVFPLECIGGLYKNDYLNWEKGQGSAGLELSRWNQVTLGQVKTLNSEGIYTVEQFAAMPSDRVEGRFPKDLVKAFKDAIHYCNAQKPALDMVKHADDLMELKRDNSKLQDTIEALKRQLDKLEAAEKPAKKKVAKRGRPKKVEVEEEEAEDFEIEEDE